MKETGIIMSGDHPAKILDGTKTMTRRVIIPQPPENVDAFAWFAPNEGEGYAPSGCWYEDDNGLKFHCKCPYGQVGDRLWVRETWATYRANDDWTISMIPKTATVFYKADDEPYGHIGKARPSIFMPRWASRIERIIVLLRAERLRDISEADAQAEGGYTIAEFISLFLKLNHLSEDANPWNWVIGW